VTERKHAIQYYRSLAKAHGGYEALEKNARLFMVPGMAHCGGGPGPNAFGQMWATSPAGPDSDIVVAMEHWVENGEAPKSIVVAKFEHDDPKRAVLRTMPLCPFPPWPDTKEQAISTMPEIGVAAPVINGCSRWVMPDERPVRTRI